MALPLDQDWIEEHRRELARRTTQATDKAAREARDAAAEALQSIPDPQLRVVARLLADLMGRDPGGNIDAWRADWHLVAIASLLKSARDGAPGA